MKEQLTQALELLRGGYIQQAYELIQEIIVELNNLDKDSSNNLENPE